MAPFVLGIIPARGGSKGIPRKNVLVIGGKPLIVHTIDDARTSRLLTRTVVSTDDSEIAAVARAAGAEVVLRPAEFATDTAPIEGSLRHAVTTIEHGGARVDIVVWLSGNNPLRVDGVIDQCVQKLIDTRCDSVQTVVPYRKPIEWSLRMEGDRLLPSPAYRFVVRRQDCMPVYHLDGAVIVMRRDALMAADDGSLGYPLFYGRDRRAVAHPAEVGIDLDDELDLKFLRFVMDGK